MASKLKIAWLQEYLGKTHMTILDRREEILTEFDKD